MATTNHFTPPTERATTMTKQTPTRISTVAQYCGGKGLVALALAIIFFILATAVPLSIQNRTHTAKFSATETNSFSNDEPPTLDPTGRTTNSPSAYTHSVLPKIDDDDVISNSRDDFYLRPRPSSTPSAPAASIIPTAMASIGPTGFQSDKPSQPGSMTPSGAESSTPSNNPTEHPSTAPSSSPTDQPSGSPSSIPSNPPSSSPSDPSLNDAFVPGLLAHMEHGLMLSAGLTARKLATSGQKVIYHNGTLSALDFHGMHTRPGADGWVYLSNSEMGRTDNGNIITDKGGVGAITFDRHGSVIDYEMRLTGTTMNCGGGRTPWNTWISCEEYNEGRNYQVDPMGIREAWPITMGMEGGHWESFAADASDPDVPRFFVTEDAEKGALQRFTPFNITWDPPEDAWKMLHGPGKIEYLMLNPNSATGGTFSWTTNRDNARSNAKQFYPNSEGIDINDGRLYFVCKKIKVLFELDLVTATYTSQSTTHGLFDGGPDQLQRILVDGAEEFLFFTEEGGKDPGIHGRDATGMFFTLLESPVYNDETTGLAFSPDAIHLYVAYQKTGILFDVTRLDGLPFHAKSLNVKYHADL